MHSLFLYFTTITRKISERGRTRTRDSWLHRSSALFSSVAANLRLISLFPMQGNQRKIRRIYDTNNSTDFLAKRDNPEVYATILEVAINGGTKKFQVLHEGYTDPEELKVHLRLLVQNGLLMKEALIANERFNCRGDDINSYHRTTNKGFVYLEFYRQLERHCPSFTMCLGK